MTAPCDLSLGEIEALVKRAARGAGLPWGLADEAGKAVRWLEAHGLPGSVEMVNTLEATGETGTEIAKGASFCDQIDRFDADAGQTLGSVNHPLLILPFIALAARELPFAVQVHCGRDVVVCDGASVGSEAALLIGKHGAPVVVSKTSEAVVSPLSRQSRASVSADVKARFEDLASRTYAPATEASRLLGAGAGDSDND